MGPDAIPLFGMITGVLISGSVIWGVVKIMQSQVGQALARRISGRHGDDDELRTEVGYLRDQLDEVQRQLTETQERLDFTERMLTRGRPTPEDQ